MKQIVSTFVAVAVVFGFSLAPVRAQTLPPFSEEQLNEITRHKKAMEQYKIIDSALYQLAVAKNVKTFAETHGIKLIDNQVQVIITVNNPSKYTLPAAFGTEQTRSQNDVQVLVPVNKILELGRDENVQSVRFPYLSKAVTSNDRTIAGASDASSSAISMSSDKACVGQKVSAATKVRSETMKAAKATLDAALQGTATKEAKTAARQEYKKTIRAAQHTFQQAAMKTKQECKITKQTKQQEQRERMKIDHILRPTPAQ